MTVFSGLRGAALFIVVIVTVGVIGYHVLGEYTWLEALYMTVITLSTVGFHEVQPLDPKGQIFTIVLIPWRAASQRYGSWILISAKNGERNWQKWEEV